MKSYVAQISICIKPTNLPKMLQNALGIKKLLKLKNESIAIEVNVTCNQLYTTGSIV